jgi:hypothetical protein
LLAVPSCVYKWSINSISNSKPRLYSHTPYYVTVMIHQFTKCKKKIAKKSIYQSVMM